MYGLHGSAGGYRDTGIDCASSGNTCTNAIARNNLWINNVYPPGFAGFTESNNIKNTPNGASFVNAAAGDFHLTANTPAGYAIAPVAGQTFNLDPDGNVRSTWSIGAYEYTGTTPVGDTVAPVVGTFTIPSTATSLTVPISTFTVTDNTGVTGYMITTTNTTPSASATGWTTTAPTSYTVSAAGTYTLYAWAKDAAGNVSTAKSASVTVTVSQPSGTTFYVVPSTTTGLSTPNNGSDWSHAYLGLPATLVRGATYYVAGGSYGGYTFQPLSGTAYVYITKATAANSGSVIGWQATYGTNQAVFSSSGNLFTVHMTNLSIDGVNGDGSSSNTSGYGIKLVTTGSANSTITSSGYAFNGLILKHLEVQCPVPNGNQSGFCIASNMSWNGTPSNTLYQYLYIHGGLVGILVDGTNQIIEHSYLKDMAGQQHAEMINAANVTNLTIRYNVFENMIGPSGTTYIEPQSNGGPGPNGVYIYGNVFRATRADETTTNPSVYAETSGETGKNIFIYTISS